MPLKLTVNKGRYGSHERPVVFLIDENDRSKGTYFYEIPGGKLHIEALKVIQSYYENGYEIAFKNFY